MTERDPLTAKVIGCALEVDPAFATGILESTYEQGLARKISLWEVNFQLQVALPVEYKGELPDCAYPISMLVERRQILELLAVEATNRRREARLYSSPRLSSFSTGLLMKFNVELLKGGLRRFRL